jgi:hypothetical protein
MKYVKFDLKTITSRPKGVTMPLFGKRKAEERKAEEQQNAAKRKAWEDAREAFDRDFQDWFERIAQLQADTGSPVLTDEILMQAGEFPRPYNEGSLHELQQISLASYARTYVNRRLEGKTIDAVISAKRAKETGSAEVSQLEGAAQFWENVKAYLETR